MTTAPTPPPPSPGVLGTLLPGTAAVSRPLAGVGAAMVLSAVVAAVLLFVDPRTVGDAPAWLKPLKFAVSIAAYALSLAWVVRHLEGKPRLRRAVNLVAAVALPLELVLIGLQAGRGRLSHFNFSTPVDMVIFQVMGFAITAFWVTQVALTLALARQRFLDPALAATLRWAMLLAVLGAAVGYLMTVPRADQLAHGMPVLVGSHTIGAPDGGPGLPLVTWSREHGDLRPAHFFGLHALQLLPLAAWLLARPRLRLRLARRLGAVHTVGASALGLLAILVWQAMRGQSIAAPDGLTGGVLGGWLLATAVGFTWALRSVERPAVPRPSRSAVEAA